MTKIEQAWHSNASWLWFLWPLSILFALISACRRALYRSGLLNSSKPKAFVLVVGNISVGGNGKTPLVIALVEFFLSRNVKVGVLSRGYGGAQSAFPHQVTDADSAKLVGDEPKLIAARTGVPVVIDPVRKRGADYLAGKLQCQVIICDDGLQHYALSRDMEIVVMDERRYGNGRLLPMGPLREGVWRLNTVHSIVHNVSGSTQPALPGVVVPQYAMQLISSELVNVRNPAVKLSVAEFLDRYSECSAIAGIGNPERFFHHLNALGLTVEHPTAFADHHSFTAQDLPGSAVIMTEKDAVKIQLFAHQDCWYLPVTAQLNPSFYRQVFTAYEHYNNQQEGQPHGV
ncbi:tetraacyldisaccharide 4'-kinase [Alteromonas aestuariivivens]|uniref:Tetraacyldisaccharide 4'-kinase n=1 Tax=Alteromonas aestuariivivens TaxID=1938339 RepID=A0A3D8M8M5_9ALTE|nr:tetraacyldisaccharide 4'-kinase [Alteromonas aestuariivivens]RDV26092.1 tetraacyldisaccharide 4'-kinase [Alteromonas aestuariivivens]